MNKYIVEVPDGGDYRKVEVQADSIRLEGLGLALEREKEIVGAFSDWICFYRKETGDSPCIDRRGGFER